MLAACLVVPVLLVLAFVLLGFHGTTAAHVAAVWGSAAGSRLAYAAGKVSADDQSYAEARR
jgi:hypothetical protein